MTVVDANLLLYAYNADAPQQPAAARWVAELSERGDTVGGSARRSHQAGIISW